MGQDRQGWGSSSVLLGLVISCCPRWGCDFESTSCHPSCSPPFHKHPHTLPGAVAGMLQDAALLISDKSFSTKGRHGHSYLLAGSIGEPRKHKVSCSVGKVPLQSQRKWCEPRTLTQRLMFTRRADQKFSVAETAARMAEGEFPEESFFLCSEGPNNLFPLVSS